MRREETKPNAIVEELKVSLIIFLVFIVFVLLFSVMSRMFFLFLIFINRNHQWVSLIAGSLIIFLGIFLLRLKVRKWGGE